jgi:hypothetical protein
MQLKEGPPALFVSSENRRSKARVPSVTLVVCAIVVLGMIRGTAVGGVSMALGVMALFGLMTGLYVGITGRSSWALLKGGRPMGVVVALGALMMFVASLSVYGEQAS